jgi:hypothetical protein
MPERLLEADLSHASRVKRAATGIVNDYLFILVEYDAALFRAVITRRSTRLSRSIPHHNYSSVV